MYGLFWTLEIHDIYVPTKTYEREMEKVCLWRGGVIEVMLLLIWGPHTEL
jgi:hypothetical protein